jgi:hypothetical protein
LAYPNRKPSRSKPSLSRHPLFPAIVALWFAALFGLGSLALRPALLEALVLAGHIDHFVPAAAPPLGAKARLLLALLLGIVGAAIGWTLAKRLVERGPRPAPQVLKVADVDLDEPLPRPGDTEKAAPPPLQDEGTGPVFHRGDPVPQAAPVEPTAQEPPAPREDPEPPQEPGLIVAEPAPMTAAERIAVAPLDSLSHVELMERLALGLRRRRELLEAAAAAGVPQPVAPEPADAVVRLRRLSERNGARAMAVAAVPKPVSQETEKALRDALATLQRISGSG